MDRCNEKTDRRLNLLTQIGENRSRRFARALIVVLAIALGSPNVGCRLCCDSEDIAYPAYGGAWQRTRRDSGRVGSIFDPAGARTPILVDRDDPVGIDVIDRQRQAATGDAIRDEEGSEKSTDPDASPDPSIDEGQSELERRADELKSMELEDISTIPGDPAPPDLN